MITIPTTAKELASFRKTLSIPRGATHFRLTVKGHNPITDTVKNLDVAGGCTGAIEFGKMTGRGKSRQFQPMEVKTPRKRASAAKKASKKSAAAEPTASAPKGPRKGTRHTILDFSACSVLKALGKAGARYPEADAILKHHGIEMPKSSVSVQLGFGRNEKSWARHGQPAKITKTQISALRSVYHHEPSH